MEKRVVGVVGPIGAGKDTLAHLIESRLGFFFFNISDIVRDLARAAGVRTERDPLTEFSARMLMERGETYFVDQCVDQIRDLDRCFVVLSGVRTPANVAALSKAFRQDFFLVAIDIADSRVRYRRVRDREGPSSQIGPAEFAHHDAEQERVFQLSDTMALSQLRVDNSGELSDLEKWVIANETHLRGGPVGTPRHGET